MIDAIWLRILLVALAGWVNRHQLEVIKYLREENRVLKEYLGGRCLRLTDAQRRRRVANGPLCSARMMRADVSVSCGLVDDAIFVVQPVENRRRDDATAGGQVMAGDDQRVPPG